ncbi:MAG: fasciclin domain-containing protein [Bacteroidales bacterium]|nr:fasciclin domain-containing protein [Bacteroidales bacterium]
MKKITAIVSLLAVVLGFYSCIEEKELDISFKDVEKYSIYDYIVQHKEQYSSFLSILEAGNLDQTLSAYNPEGEGYTLFLPDNAAIDAFIAQSETYASLNDLLNDEVYVWAFCRYHVVNEMIDVNDFPFGALSDYTLTEDYLTVSFVNETDTSYYSINNQAPIIQENIEMSNGFIHIVKNALVPVTMTAYDWLNNREGFSIFRDAVEETGLVELFSINPKEDPEALRVTFFLESDEIFGKAGIHSFAELAEHISPERTDYSDPMNPLYNFIAYHLLSDYIFLDDFMEISTNYATYSDIPLHVDGRGTDIVINRGKQMFDTIIDGTDSTFINYVGINYDASNVLTQSGVIHQIDQVMEQQTPSRALQTWEVYERPYFDEFAVEVGSYLIEDSTLLSRISYTGTDLVYEKMSDADAPNSLWSDDYIFLDGDFTVNFITPKLVQGNYTVFLHADTYNDNNAVVEIFIDGKPIGGSFDLTNIGSPTAEEPFVTIELGDMNFLKYESHKITVRTLIPGSFSWDFIRFEPI